MKWFAETTEWPDAKSDNHIYLLDDSKSKMFAYVKHGRGLPEKFSKPIRIDIRGRKFKLNPEQYQVDVEAEVPLLFAEVIHLVLALHGSGALESLELG